MPGAGGIFTILLLPVVLILCNTLVSQLPGLKGTSIDTVVSFLGNPVIALFITLCLGAFILAKDLDNKTVINMMNDA